MAVTVYFVLAFVSAISALSGQYVPKSFFVIDHDGHQSDVVYIRSRRDVLKPLLRFRRGVGSGGGSSASSNAHASSSSGSSGGGGNNYDHGGFNPGIIFPTDFEDFAQNFVPANLNLGAGGAGGGKAGAHSFASSHSSGSSGGGSGGGYGNQGHAGGLGAGHEAGYQGPILFSRFGEGQGTGVEASGAAQGQRGAFSSVSTSSDGDGNVKYSVKSGKY
ncbi:hypothetical protein JTB14_003029 [Gonioctena quinquepunctata]|nr:hypothetical protein JTB14_003029 [Gonioctena quinquepunctata]